MTLTTAIDALLAAAWVGLALDNLRLWRRDRGLRGPVPDRTSPSARLGVLIVLLGGAALLEVRSGGRFAFHPGGAVVGLLLVAAGLALHVRARRALGALWSSAVGVRAGHVVVRHGPYAVIRHPLYLGVALMAAGTVLAHPSAATACIAVGLAAGMALKIPAEERALRAACGETWTRYAAAVPALVPWPSRVRAALTSRASR